MRFRISAIIISLSFVASVDACLWDRDTLAMEKREFPEAVDLITGKFLRHTSTYYEWRVEDREMRLQEKPDQPDLIDDLATAYDKLGQSGKAIELMQHKLTLDPDAYKTHANLGTFYIHNRQLEKGLEHIKRAIEINPDAHFGREIYQQKLVEYVIEKSVDGKLQLPMNTESGYRAVGFSKWIKKDVVTTAHEKLELKKAEKGILGMMRFGNYDSPVLLEALGDLLYAKDAKRLACRAYLKASYECEDEKAKLAYREKARQALRMQTKHKLTTSELTVPELEKTFTKELKDATKWYSKIVKDEASWRAKGLNLDDEFSKKYYQ